MSDTIIKQRSHSDCVAALAAQATNTTLDDVGAWGYKEDGPMPPIDLARYLLDHGLSLGLGVDLLQPVYKTMAADQKTNVTVRLPPDLAEKIAVAAEDAGMEWDIYILTALGKLLSVDLSKPQEHVVVAYEGTPGSEIKRLSSFVMSIPLHRPAKVSVLIDDNKKMSHACYWNGKELLDPSTGSVVDLVGLEIIKWYPIVPFAQFSAGSLRKGE